jgi:predicted peroxiredoxin
MGPILNIVETAYRGTLEEQDDTILWLTTMLKMAGADVAVLLRANAVNYAVKGQDASGLHLGERPLANPPRLDHDVQVLIESGARVYLVREDARDRGLRDEDLVAGLQMVSRTELPAILERFEAVWHW